MADTTASAAIASDRVGRGDASTGTGVTIVVPTLCTIVGDMDSTMSVLLRRRRCGDVARPGVTEPGLDGEPWTDGPALPLPLPLPLPPRSGNSSPRLP